MGKARERFQEGRGGMEVSSRGCADAAVEMRLAGTMRALGTSRNSSRNLLHGPLAKGRAGLRKRAHWWFGVVATPKSGLGLHSDFP